MSKTEDLSGLWLLVLFSSSYFWYDKLVTSSFNQGTIFLSGGILVILAYLVDHVFDKGKQSSGGVDYRDLPIDTLPERSTSMPILERIVSRPLYQDIILGIILSAGFFRMTQLYGIQWAGIPAIGFAGTLVGKAFATGMVAFAENGISTTLASTFRSHSDYFGGRSLGKTGHLIASGVLAALVMVALHGAVYGLNADALRTVLVFFSFGNIVSLWRENSVAFSILHFSWNYLVISTSLDVALGMAIVGASVV